jgi:hypothetical protein
MKSEGNLILLALYASGRLDRVPLAARPHASLAFQMA